ncbi:hypothetical protein [Thiorhodovibrio frisius]|uniref:Uncharacterized protein n=1 Tax=Thiorhodovibrio frisius TaxID=631362 RepID=H8Z2A6_9GAMM|nr:hypothetical protein [Thiorhodovibrio frisius]EIC22668.1 hypothetical protein Thi970DRAFT_02946 [Thiorhodovibrio frisius]WPL22424.1 hypothetical protein Thiofri_02588 [Thiorhodovibrio frisius]
MSQSPSTDASTGSSSAKSKGGGSMLLGLMPLLVLFGATVLLYNLTSGGFSEAFMYWEYFMGFIALYFLFSGWSQAYLNGNSSLWYLIRQCVHWGALFALVYVLNIQGIRELIPDPQYTILLLYLIAFTTLLAAIQMNIKMIFFAAFMVFVAYLIAVPENNPALIKLGEAFQVAEAPTKPLMMTIWVAVAGFVGTLFFKASMGGAISAKRAASKH